MRQTAAASVSILVGALIVAFPAPALAATIVDLGTLPGGSVSTAEDINEAGVVVGNADLGSGVFHAVRWDSRGVITDLGALPGNTNSSVTAINDLGTIIGESGGPVRWSSSGAIQALDRLPGDDSAVASAINNSGITVGTSTNIIPVDEDFEFEQHAVRWEPGTATPTTLPVLPDAVDSVATAINDSGAITGSVTFVEKGAHAVRWNADGTVTVLGPLPGGKSSSAGHINDAGVVVGSAIPAGKAFSIGVLWKTHDVAAPLPLLPRATWSVTIGINEAGIIAGYAAPTQLPHAVRWTNGGTAITDLGTLSGHDRSLPSEINEAGVIVGTSDRNGTPTSSRAVRWDPGGQIANLGLLPRGTISTAGGINSSGTIFGTANNADGHWRAVIWRP